MKKFLIILFLCIIYTLFIFAQTDNIIRKRKVLTTSISKVTSQYPKVAKVKRSRPIEQHGNIKLPTLNGNNSVRNDDGSHYEGNFVDGHFCGQGKYTFPDGMVVTGEFANDVPNGKCTITMGNGFVSYEGIMTNGEIRGQGTKYYSDSLYIEGCWYNNGNNATNAILHCGHRIEQGSLDGGNWNCDKIICNIDIQEDNLLITINGVDFTMVKVNAGSFMMGSNNNKNEKPIHKVTLTEPYYIGQTEVTQKLWFSIMEKKPNDIVSDQQPVFNVSWDECQNFISELNRIVGGTLFSLPTEAQWEYAAKGGEKSKNYKFSGSNKYEDVAWCSENSNGTVHPVGEKKPNELGIYDMSGNVYEWCSDWYSLYSKESTVDPQGPTAPVKVYSDIKYNIIDEGSEQKTLRGGSYGGWYKASTTTFRTGGNGWSPGVRLVINNSAFIGKHS